MLPKFHLKTKLSDFHKMTRTILKTYFISNGYFLSKVQKLRSSFVTGRISIKTQRFTTKLQKSERFSRFLSPNLESSWSVEDKLC